MNDDRNSQYSIRHLANIGKSRIGILAETCGKALKAISNPAAIKVSIKIPGLSPEIYADGNKRYQNYLLGFLKKYGFEDDPAKIKDSGFLVISTDTEEIVCIGTVRHINNVIGFAAAISRLPETGAASLSDGLSLVLSQVESRINAVMMPGSPSSLEILGRKLLDALTKFGVCAVCIKPAIPEHLVVSMARADKGISLFEIDEFPDEEPVQNKGGIVIDRNEISLLWPGINGIATGIWIKDSRDRLMAFGFSDKKHLNKSAREKIDRRLELSADDDIDYIVKSFEKLKADFKQMVKSERAAAVTETAVTVNHEINNPLTAILGNTQLLLMNKDKLAKETVTKLQTIEKSAIQIREVTDKLMTIIEPVRKHYASGLQMIDIEKSKKRSDEEK
jgi:hypothetical protein